MRRSSVPLGGSWEGTCRRSSNFESRPATTGGGLGSPALSTVNVLEQAAQELLVAESHLATLAVMGVVFPWEGDAILAYRQKSEIGNGHAMGVARQVL